MKEQEGKYVLVHGQEIVDFFRTYEDAIKSGDQRSKLEPFLVKQVHAIEPVFFASRHAAPASISS